MRYILASNSKFKKEIFEKVGYNFECIDSNFEKEKEEKEKYKEDKELKEKKKDNIQDPYEYVMYLAKGKVESVYNGILEEGKSINEDMIIIGLDTIVYSDNNILEKPKSKKEAMQNLLNSSNKKNEVISGICIIYVKDNTISKEIVDYDNTYIYFNEIRKEDAKYYAENEKDALYASGFVVETYVSNFVKKIEGNYYNILGVPVSKIYSHLNSLGIYLSDLNDLNN